MSSFSEASSSESISSTSLEIHYYSDHEDESAHIGYDWSLQENALQKFCLFKIVENFEHYPDEELARIPTKLRRLILPYLPVADIGRLTGTTYFFEEIDAEEIWKQIYLKNIPRYFKMLKCFPMCSEVNEARKTLKEKCSTFRERYLSILATIIMNCARPSGSFAGRGKHDGCMYYMDPPPPSILKNSPLDIVYTLIAGEKVVGVIKKAKSTAYTYEEIDDEDYFEHRNTLYTAVADYQIGESHIDDRLKHRHEQYYTQIVERYKLYVPPRYQTEYATVSAKRYLSDEDAITLLTKKCGYLPKHLIVSASAFSSKKWNPGLLQAFLCQLESLKLCFDENASHEAQHLLNAVMSSSKPVLSSLTLFDSVRYRYGSIVLQYRQLHHDDCLSFIPIYDSEFDEEFETVETELPKYLSFLSPHTLITLNTLQELSLCGNITGNDLDDLVETIRNQKSLTSFSLDATSEPLYLELDDEHGSAFIDALILVFGTQNFQRVELINVILPQVWVQNLLDGFFQSMLSCKNICPVQHTQVLKCEGEVLVDANRLEPSDVYKPFTLSLDLSPRSCLKQPHLLPLPLQSDAECHGLKFCFYDPQELLFDCVLITVNCSKYFNEVGVRAKSLLLSQLRIQSKLQLAGWNLLGSESLEFLFFSHPINPDYVSALLQQLSFLLTAQSNLKVIKVSEVVINPDTFQCSPFSYESFAKLSDSLFSVPNLSQLKFEILLQGATGDQIDTRLIELMHNSWKKNSSGQKPKKFELKLPKGADIADPQIQPNAAELANEIGLDIVYV